MGSERTRRRGVGQILCASGKPKDPLSLLLALVRARRRVPNRKEHSLNWLWCKFKMKPDFGHPALSNENGFCLSSQGSVPDFRHRCRPAAQLAEFELSLLDLLCQLDSTDHDCCVLEALQSQHWAKPLLYPSMVLFNGVVRYLLVRTRTRFGNSPVAFKSVTARCEAA